jgi:hypothetical protein
MTKVIQAIATLKQGFISKPEIIANRKANFRLGLSFAGIITLLALSYLNGGLFMDKLVIVFTILSCVLLVKTMGER